MNKFFTIGCPSCKRAHTWFSGNPDQRCTKCRDDQEWVKANRIKANTRVVDPFATDKMTESGAINVLEENEPRAIEVNVPFQYHGTVRGRYTSEDAARGPETTPSHSMSFGEWARNIRTVKLMERCKNFERDQWVAHLALQSHNSSLRAVNDDHQKLNGELRRELDAAKAELGRRRVNISKLESELRLMKAVVGAYSRQAERNRKRILDHENTIKANDDFIELQGKRLQEARNIIRNISQAAGLAIPDESSLDP